MVVVLLKEEEYNIDNQVTIFLNNGSFYRGSETLNINQNGKIYWTKIKNCP